MMDHKVEILAPCGTMESLDAAVSAGADACYLAGDSFGARAFAGNFGLDALASAVEKAHLHQVKIYLTVNTLVKNQELSSLYQFLKEVYQMGIDAVLVQDLGVVEMVHTCFPELPIHASTQMNLCTPDGAAFAKKEGFTRVVAARENSLEELAEIRKKVDIELETFVHGAMCFCYSGRCLMSSFLGGRSGNRGRCAQPCRRKYQGSYRMSMKDLCTLHAVPALIRAGIDSLKIEGRMKNAVYTAAAVDAYRTMAEDYAHGCFSDQKADLYEKRMADIFNRGGFSSGYFFMKPFSSDRKGLIDDKNPGQIGLPIGTVKKTGGGKVEISLTESLNPQDSLKISTDHLPVELTSGLQQKEGHTVWLRAPRTREIKPGTTVYRMRNAVLQEQISERIRQVPGIPIEITVKICQHQRIKAAAGILRDQNLTVEVEGTEVLPAEKQPLTDKEITKQFSKWGGTDFVLKKISVRNDGKSFCRLSDLNSLRRQLGERLKTVICEKGKRDISGIMPCPKRWLRSSGKSISGRGDLPGNLYSVPNRGVLSVLLSALKKVRQGPDTGIILDLGNADWRKEDLYAGMEDIRKAGYEILLGLPHIAKCESNFHRFREIFTYVQPEGVMIRCMDDFGYLFCNTPDRCHQKFQRVVLAPSLYGYNEAALKFMGDRMKEQAEQLIFLDPLELTYEEMKNLGTPENAFRMPVVYGYLPVMITNALGERENHADMESFRDESGHAFPVFRNKEMCYNGVRSQKPLDLRDLYPGSPSFYEFTGETGEEIRSILQPAGTGDSYPDKPWRGHFRMGID